MLTMINFAYNAHVDEPGELQQRLRDLGISLKIIKVGKMVWSGSDGPGM